MRSMPNLAQPVPENRMLSTIPGVVPSLLDLPEGCNFVKRCPQAMERCKQMAPPLLELDGARLSRCWLHE